MLEAVRKSMPNIRAALGVTTTDLSHISPGAKVRRGGQSAVDVHTAEQPYADQYHRYEAENSTSPPPAVAAITVVAAPSAKQ